MRLPDGRGIDRVVAGNCYPIGMVNLSQPAQNARGRFYAIAKKKAGGVTGGGNCLKARSKRVRR